MTTTTTTAMLSRQPQRRLAARALRQHSGWLACCLMAAGLLIAPAAQAQETVCARVKIEIKQELTLERQAFDAEMKINNTTDSGVIENVSPVLVTDNPNDTSAKFFVRLSNKQNISDVEGTGTVNPQTTSIINWGSVEF